MKRIAIIGTRGIPAAYGGFETLAERLSLTLRQRGYDVTVIGNTGISGDQWQGVRRIRTRFNKQDHPVLFYLESLWRSRQGFDRVLVCGVGGAPFYFILPIRQGERITHVDGLEHLRSRFSKIKKWYVRQAQRILRNRAALIVSDSAAVTDYWKSTLHHRASISTIAYGADLVTDADRSLLPGPLRSGEYYLVVARPVPENNLAMIVQAWLASGSSKRLVIVGSDGSESFYDFLAQEQRERVDFLGSIYEPALLASLRFHAFAYVHGHSVGGTNPALVEAMAAGAYCLCHDNPFNRETTLGAAVYFSEADSLKNLINALDQTPASRRQEARMRLLQLAQEHYSWNRITDQYVEIFELANR